MLVWHDDYSWLPLSEACKMFGMTYGSAKNAVLQNRFPVDVYKIGRYLVVDRDVIARYFNDKKQTGFAKLGAPVPRIDKRFGPHPERRGRRKKSAAPDTSSESSGS